MFSVNGNDKASCEMLLGLEMTCVKDSVCVCCGIHSGPHFSPLTEPKTAEEEESNFSSPLMLWLSKNRSGRKALLRKSPEKDLFFEISSDDGFQICAESIEGEWVKLGWPDSTGSVQSGLHFICRSTIYAGSSVYDRLDWRH